MNLSSSQYGSFSRGAQGRGAKRPKKSAQHRKRVGIETSYRPRNEARIKTCTRNPPLRLLFVGVALVLRNVWVWLDFRLAKGKWSEAWLLCHIATVGRWRHFGIAAAA